MPELIYKIVNTVNDFIYVGKTSNLHKRWLKHQNDAKNGSMLLLHRMMREHGIQNFHPEIIEDDLDYETARSRETYWIRILNTVHPHGYNGSAPKLTDTEAAIVKYDAWHWTLEQYAQFFGMSILTLKALRTGGHSHFHVTEQHLPVQSNEFLSDF